MIPYGRQSIDEEDIQAVVEALRSDWLTTGPEVERFEAALAEAVGAPHAVAISSGTAALHAAMRAVGVGPGDEVIVPTMTFAATANAVVYEGARPVFADVSPDTLLIDLASVEARLSARTKAIVAVDYAGHPCDWDALGELARRHGLALVADGCHALGARLRGRPVGQLADLTTFSFHPVKHVTTTEGGAIVTSNADYAAHMRRFRNHGITTDQRQRSAKGTHAYEMVELGYNYRLSDIACALGRSQLRKLEGWNMRRRALAARYDEAFGRPLVGRGPAEGMEGALRTESGVLDAGRREGASQVLRPLLRQPDVEHAYHLYVVRCRGGADAAEARDALYQGLRADGIGTNVHYMPVHLHPFYRRTFGTAPGDCPNAERAYATILSLPMYPGLSDQDQDRVIARILERAYLLHDPA